MSKNMEQFEYWLSCNNLEESLRAELVELKGNLEKSDENVRFQAEFEISDRFYRELEFGTGGLRGVLGAGSNRMNVHTVRKATFGVAKYINTHYQKPSAAISYDSRINSELFAKTAAECLLSEGIDVYIYDTLMPAPALSFATRFHGCAIGIMITASHNPSKYNGYKVYNQDGCQVTSDAAEEILRYIGETDVFHENGHTSAAQLIYMKEETKRAFYDAVFAERMIWDSEPVMRRDMEALSVVYSPLNGSGNLPVREILKRIGVGKISVVKEQELPDGNFPTCPYPNPEKREALKKGLELCQAEQPDLLLATDPDCDRIGTAILHDGDYVLPTGNEIGILLFDFICQRRSSGGLPAMPKNPVFVRTIVSSKLGDLIAADYGVSISATLTGFKFIGEYIAALEQKGREQDFIFGYEESYGYLSGTYVRDKDAVNAAMLICQMAAYYKSLGKTLAEKLKELYEKYGYYINDLMEFTFEGEAGMHKMSEIMEEFRSNPPGTLADKKVVEMMDYAIPGDLPKADVIEFLLENGSSFIARPSGTEPKLKIYISAKGVTHDEAAKVVLVIKSEIAARFF